MSYVIPAIALAKGYLEIDGVPLDTPAWTTVRLDDLFSSAPLRGDDLVLPGVQGARAMPRRRAIARAEIELVVFGDSKWDGTLHADPHAGLLMNEAHLLQNVAAIPATADSTRSLIFHMPDPSYELPATWVATVHVEQLRFVRAGLTHATGQLSLSIPAGGLSGVWSF